MNGPKLFTTKAEIIKIKENIKKYDWYNQAYLSIKEHVDNIIDKGFKVPSESGYVFFETCNRDNTPLIFDPYKPNEHICPTCNMNYLDDPYRRAWILKYHAWLSQISLFFGITYLISDNERYALALKKLLCEYVIMYPNYPNDDNELGPTKVFQSTYMESVWLTHLAGAYDMVKNSNVFSEKEHKDIENELFRPSVKIIMDYDELWNNRQAFNNTGICAIGYLYNDKVLIDYALYGKHGFFNHMKYSVLEDGLWYEGDNYHFATLPSMINIAEMAYRNGTNLYNQQFNGHTINMMFMAPLKSLQPDLTFPSRKDSGYATNIAKKWYVGLYEVAYKRYKEKAYASVLNVAYSYVKDDKYNLASAAGIMDIFKPEIARRSRLDWRGFLNITPDLEKNSTLPYTESINMKGTGLAVLRNKNSYVSLDYGDYGGGHGHPDRLNLSYFYKGKRWLSDFGTCNYYLNQLKWYRSTIGHNTVTIDGQTHLQVDGVCGAFSKIDNINFVSGKVDNVLPGVNMNRNLILFDNGLLLDLFNIESNEKHKYHYALHSFGNIKFDDNTKLNKVELFGDNYDFLKNINQVVGNKSSCCKFIDNSDLLNINYLGEANTKVYKANTYGPPNELSKSFNMLIIEKENTSCSFITLFEGLSKDEKEKVEIFKEDKNGVITIKLKNRNSYEIIRKSDVVIISEFDNGKFSNKYSFKIENTKIKKNEEGLQGILHIEEWVPTDSKKIFKILLKNKTTEKIRIKTSFILREIVLEANKSEIIEMDFNKLEYIKNNQRIKFDYSLTIDKKTYNRSYEKAFTKIKDVTKKNATNKLVFEPNILINSQLQMRRGDKVWRGEKAISAKAMILNKQESLNIWIKVIDDNVLFEGGKYPYDNDSIQVYVNRRAEKYRNLEKITKDVYGILVLSGVNGNCASINKIDNSKIDINRIGVSVVYTMVGYDTFLDIPWNIIGGIPNKGDIIGFDIIVNDRDTGERRDFQMLWSGCEINERIYLKEDKHQPTRYGLLEI